MHRQHNMPFGAQLSADGVRFRLWAPSCRRVDLCLEHAPSLPALPMRDVGDGWFELDVAEAGAGSRYRFEVNGGLCVPDPASRFNPDDVHAASEVIDATAFAWTDTAWHGRPWHEAVIYELHVGTFSTAGNYAGVIARLDYLAELGVSAIELMPLADFPGARNWGYDGVLPFAPDSRYGRPEDLKALVQAAHARGLMVLLDVVYNHFGPEGNYLHAYAENFFSQKHHTPWGAAINFDGPGSATVREFFIHNALYWLREYHLDGLRLDAVHAIADDSATHILTQLARRARAAIGDARQVHLILENDANQARYLSPATFNAQWNDDLHHALHVLCSGETDGYYADYAESPIHHLGRSLAQGFAYQGEASAYRKGASRGEASAHLPAPAFVGFLQNHDQVGNRALGERIHRIAPVPAIRAAVAILLLAPEIPLLFMGEEFAASTPFPFFCDFEPGLRAAISQGRRREFAKFKRYADPAAQAAIPDPNRLETFLSARLDWNCLRRPEHAEWLDYYRSLLALRRDRIVPRLPGMAGGAGQFEVLPAGGLTVAWRLGDGSMLRLLANLTDNPIQATSLPGARLYATEPITDGVLPAWQVIWTLEAAG